MLDLAICLLSFILRNILPHSHKCVRLSCIATWNIKWDKIHYSFHPAIIPVEPPPSSGHRHFLAILVHLSLPFSYILAASPTHHEGLVNKFSLGVEKSKGVAMKGSKYATQFISIWDFCLGQNALRKKICCENFLVVVLYNYNSVGIIF